MAGWVALLRGINVNGITITMADLRAVFRGLGYTDVRTVLASGNVLFTAGETDAAALKATIERALSDNFGYQAWIVLLGVDALDRVARAFPFDAERDGWHPYVVFGSARTALEELLEAAGEPDPETEQVRPGTGVLYWQVRRSIGINSPFSKLSGKARYRSTTTTRNLRTLNKLIAAAPGA
ncbi:DUF1697 domain-containing protein [Cryobacterium sp. Hz7]|uniref:DUF1697 domain-containing protein n=1 Tax=Cryobacterium sandaracinum TaxID=1259247 RepID=A0ABY2JJ48_9MICO|nr:MULTISPECIES: DUF1697 domain-containing protein [Cryobacterium]TFB53781.1 DUF1697 domain-containing protein [Cryobacterium sp. Sr3]TFB57900.1 DUF1697 domain-containing protein [Cryobacterium sp. Hz7]TFC39400.1 DUF1697 domain-containing protein [Cryobacterium sp. TMT2-14]TFC70791.1 DUF1697 domain-containing protein [Cryobacterium sp. TMT2-4]TFD07227.1 DUF1697 domain-containing protein [Cryobacterium sandaracinum]